MKLLNYPQCIGAYALGCENTINIEKFPSDFSLFTNRPPFIKFHNTLKVQVFYGYWHNKQLQPA